MSTTCVFPPELDDKQLLAYLDDPDGNPETARHLAGCPHCKENAHALHRFQKSLTTHLYRATCPTPLELGEFHIRMMAPAQRLVIAQHLRECPHCTQEVSQLEGFMNESGPRINPLEVAKTLIARLVSGGASLGTALRGAAKTLPVFDADGIVISLDVHPDPKGELSILGQIAADDQDQWTGASVELKQPYMAPLHASVDDLGAFTINTVDPGSIQLDITSKDGTVIQSETVVINV